MPKKHFPLKVSAHTKSPVQIAVPFLSNYVIRGPAELHFNGLSSVEGDSFTIDPAGEVFEYTGTVPLDSNDTLVLEINYSSVVDYEVLFRWLTNKSLVAPVARYYEELTDCIANESWLAASILCGSVAEAILCDILGMPGGKPTLGVLIGQAERGHAIDARQAAALGRVCDARNALHADAVAAGRAQLPNRSTALQAVAAIERILLGRGA